MSYVTVHRLNLEPVKHVRINTLDLMPSRNVKVVTIQPPIKKLVIRRRKTTKKYLR